MTAQIDHRTYPHIFSRILEHVTTANDLATMRALRGTCKDLAAALNPLLQRHVVFSLTDTHIVLRSHDGGAVLIQSRNEHQLARAQTHEPTMRILRNIETVDFHNQDYSPTKTRDLHELLFTPGAPSRTARILAPHNSARRLVGGDYPKVVSFVNLSHTRFALIATNFKPLTLVRDATTAVVNIRVDINLPFHGGILMPFAGHDLAKIVVVFDVAPPLHKVSDTRAKALLFALNKLFESIGSYIDAHSRNSTNQSPLFTFVDLHKAMWQANPDSMLGDLMQLGDDVMPMLLKGFGFPTNHLQTPFWPGEFQSRMDGVVRFLTGEEYMAEVGTQVFSLETVK
ncbi:uncharacterized protein LOC62_05G006818 [Vanrija pseudolonga]|uniref:Uncharacterized protein n=1 Tax=Vanrija pseudolonga TaxID=143232 RepID=A0AAF1BJY4_9TREE|nr:hypothetical protein LOC62_05G006818 [Vanrija pseudolonga]